MCENEYFDQWDNYLLDLRPQHGSMDDAFRKSMLPIERLFSVPGESLKKTRRNIGYILGVFCPIAVAQFSTCLFLRVGE